MFPKNILSVWLWDTFHFSLRCKKRYKKDISRKLVSHFSALSIYIRVIQEGDESAYRQEVKELAVWCNLNNMELNMLKTVEMIVDFRRNPPALPPTHHHEQLCNCSRVVQIPGHHHLSGPEVGQSHWLYCEKGPAETVFLQPANEVQSATRAADTVLLCHHWIPPLHINNCLVQLSYQI